MRTRQHPRGFTLIEISLTLLISGILIVLVTANYQRANQDTLLQREASLIMTRLRLAQEQTAAGTEQFFCYHRTAEKCTCNLVNGKCAASSGLSGCTQYCCPKIGTGCEAASPLPSGGYAVSFSCSNPNPGTTYAQVINAKTSYYYVADRVNCFGAGGVSSTGVCFPPAHDNMDSNGIFQSDGIVSIMDYNPDKGDTEIAQYTVDKKVDIASLRVTWAKNPPGMAKNWVSCGERSPWQDKNVPNLSSLTRAKVNTYSGQPYPIQATVRFLQPDGRKAAISDNIAEYAPSDVGFSPSLDLTNPVTAVEVMLSLKDRPNASCRVVKVTSSNVVTQYIDADCNFATPN